MLKNIKKIFGVGDVESQADEVARPPRMPRATRDTPLLTHSIIGQTLVITPLEHELNVLSAPEVAYESQELFDRSPGVRNVLLDLENVKHIDSAGLSMLVDLLTTVKRRSGRIAIAAATQQVEVLFKLTRLELVFVIRRSVIEAIDSLDPKG